MEIKRALMTLATLDFDRMQAFYTALLGIEPRMIQPHRYAEYHLPSLHLGLFQPSTPNQLEFSQAQHSPFSLCIQVTDLDTTIQNLTALQVTLQDTVQSASHGREIYAYDPEGNRLIFYQPGSATPAPSSIALNEHES